MSEENIKLISINRHDEKDQSFEPLSHSNGEICIGPLDINGVAPPDATDSFKDSVGLIDVEGSDEGQETKAPTSMVQKLSFLGIAITYITAAMSLSVIGPFFPNEAKKKDVNPTETGLVFGIFSLFSFLASPIWGKYLPVIGGKFLFLSGSFVTGGCNILFGFLNQIGGKTVFLTYCLVIRTVEAIGSAATLTAGMAICANVYPNDVARMMSFLEIFMGLGAAIGPPTGSLFYAVGGYQLPFIVIGSIALSATAANIFIIPNFSSSDEESREAGSLMSVLKIPAVWVMLFCNSWSCGAFGLVDATLSLHLTSPPNNVKPYLIGVMFLLFGGVYGIFAPICGYIADIKKTTRTMIAVGVFLSSISLMLIGPSPLLHLPGKLWIITVALLLFGVGLALTIVVSFLDMLTSTKCYGLPDNLATKSIVSGLYVMAYSFGTFVGPIVGGALVTRFGFAWSATYFAGGGFVTFLLVSFFTLWEFQCGKGRRNPSNTREGF